MGSGKSTVGRILAERLGWEFPDLDRAVAEGAGRSIPEIFESFGEPRFRELERRELLVALDGRRPASGPPRRGAGLSRRYAERLPYYLEVAALQVEPDNRPPSRVADEI